MVRTNYIFWWDDYDDDRIISLPFQLNNCLCCTAIPYTVCQDPGGVTNASYSVTGWASSTFLSLYYNYMITSASWWMLRTSNTHELWAQTPTIYCMPGPGRCYKCVLFGYWPYYRINRYIYMWSWLPIWSRISYTYLPALWYMGSDIVQLLFVTCLNNVKK
jgi:hypothetical protein